MDLNIAIAPDLAMALGPATVLHAPMVVNSTGGYRYFGGDRESCRAGLSADTAACAQTGRSPLIVSRCIRRRAGQ